MNLKAKAAEDAKGLRSPTIPLARDPSAAAAEEYEAARRKDTAETYEIFIARHGDDPLARFGVAPQLIQEPDSARDVTRVLQGPSIRCRPGSAHSWLPQLMLAA